MSIIKQCITAGKLAYYGQYTYRASALAFATILSIVPSIAVFIYIMSHSSQYSQLSQAANLYITKNFVPATSETVIHLVQSFSSQASRLPIISILFLLVTSISLVIAVHNTMLSIWQFNPSTKLRIIHLLIYPVSVIIFPIVMGICGILNSVLLLFFSKLFWLSIPRYLIPFILNSLIFSSLYYFTSNERMKLKNTLIGGVIASVLFEMTKLIYFIYINNVSDYNFIYGVFASLPIILIWLYLFWFIVLYGALITKVLHDASVHPS